jgi:hypothetical protein
MDKPNNTETDVQKGNQNRVEGPFTGLPARIVQPAGPFTKIINNEIFGTVINSIIID